MLYWGEMLKSHLALHLEIQIYNFNPHTTANAIECKADANITISIGNAKSWRNYTGTTERRGAKAAFNSIVID